MRNRHDEKSQVDVCNRFPTVDLLYDHARSEAKRGRRGTIYDKHVTKDLRYRQRANIRGNIAIQQFRANFLSIANSIHWA